MPAIRRYLVTKVLQTTVLVAPETSFDGPIEALGEASKQDRWETTEIHVREDKD